MYGVGGEGIHDWPTALRCVGAKSTTCTNNPIASTVDLSVSLHDFCWRWKLANALTTVAAAVVVLWSRGLWSHVRC
jgi:hypothetical protein